MAIDKKAYTAHATSVGGRNGKSESSDGALKVQLATPREMGGDGSAGTNPEQLFAAGYSACFLGAMNAVAARQKTKLSGDTKVEADVSIGPHTGKEGAFGIEVAMRISVPDMDRAEAEKLVAAAHEVCPYSNATRGNIDVTLTVV